MSNGLTRWEIERKLEEIFIYVSDIALGESGAKEYVADVRIAASRAAAETAEALMEIYEILPAEEMLGRDDLDDDGDSEPD